MTNATREEVALFAMGLLIQTVIDENELTLVNCDNDPLTVGDFIADLETRLGRHLNGEAPLYEPDEIIR